jgi:hypothetical protein
MKRCPDSAFDTSSLSVCPAGALLAAILRRMAELLPPEAVWLHVPN